MLRFRKLQMKISRLVSFLFIGLFGGTAISFAAPPVNSGAIIQQQPVDTPPALQEQIKPEQLIDTEKQPTVPEGGHKIEVNGFRFSGNKAIATEKLERLVAPWIGEKATMAELHQTVAFISMLYREQGYLLARAILPVQQVKDGIIAIQVIEPTYSRVTVNDQADLFSSAKGVLNNLRNGDAVVSEVLERNLLLLKDLPGINVKSTMTPGTDPQTTELLVDIQPSKGYSADLRFDNYGGRTNGRYRMGAGVQFFNPASLGDRLTLRGMYAIDGGDTVNGSVNYQLPVGSNGLNLATGLSLMDYELGKEYKSLDAVGEAIVFNFDGTYPLIRSQSKNLYTSLRYMRKWLTDEYKATGFEKKKQSHAVGLQLHGDRRDNFLGGGTNQFSFLIKSGYLNLDETSDTIDAVTADTAGHFNLMSLSFSRTQIIDKNWHLKGSFSMQRSNKNLDSSERMSLAGLGGVRAYPGGELSADDGELLRLDLNRRINDKLQVGIFYDLAHGKIDHNPYRTGENTRTLQGTGISLSFLPARNWYVDAVWATRLGSEKITSEPDDDESRGWFQLVRTF